MLAISPAALKELKCYLEDQIINSAVRITLMKGSCSGQNLRFTIDEARENDCIIIQDGIRFLLDKRLAADCGRITIDFDKRFDCCPCSGRDGGFRFSSPNNCQFAGSAGCPMLESCSA
jgi:Fe-S cluster assembly iron-binding protein IscA